MLETLHTTTPELVEQSEVSLALQRATSIVTELEFNDEFLAYLSSTNQTLDYEDASAYWRTISIYTDTYLDAHDELSPLERESYAVIANLPAAMIASYQLERYKNTLATSDFRTNKQTICTYNQLLKHYVTAFPQQSEPLHKELLDGVLQTVGAESADFTQHTEGVLQAILKGIRHEIGFTRLLDLAGIPYRESTVDEDLKGKDIVILFNGNEIGVDIKASLSEVEAQNKGATHNPYAIKANGNIVMYSMMLDTHFDGGFEPNKDRLKEVEATARGIIGGAVVEAIAKSNI